MIATWLHLTIFSKIADTEVLMTVVGGKVVYEKK